MANPANFTIQELSANAPANYKAAQTVDTDGTINVAVKSDTDRLLIEMENGAAAACTVKIKAGTGNQAQTAKELSFSLAATGGGAAKQILGGLESARFVKADGSIDIQFTAASSTPNVAVRIYRLPKQI